MKLIAVALVAAAEALCQEQNTRRVVVSIPDRKLVLIENGRVIKIYPTAVGADSSPTPIGSFTIIQRVANPTWYGHRKVVGPGKNNPVGTRWLGLDRKGYGIHGTNQPRSIGKNASHGCIRMKNKDVEDLYARVSVGDVVELRNEQLDTATVSGE